MTKRQHQQENPAAILEQLRKRVAGGGSLVLDSLGPEEMAAAQELIAKGEAEIISSACRPFLIAKLDRIIIP